jgi:hypothetical protein
MSRSAAVRVNHKDDLTRLIEDCRSDLRNNRTRAIGKMLQLFLGPDDSARYATDKSVQAHIASLTKVRGLQLDWGQQAAPNVCWNFRQDALTFPFGCPKPPRISDPREMNHTDKTISQDVYDYASGWVGDMRTGRQFIVLQPVVYLGVWILDGLYNLVAHPDPISGKYPALLMAPGTDEAHIIYGRFELCSARPGGAEMPWTQRESLGEIRSSGNVPAPAGAAASAPGD